MSTNTRPTPPTNDGPDIFDQVIAALAKALWRYRSEVALFVPVIAASAVAVQKLGRLAGAALIGAVVGLPVAVPSTRRWLFSLLSSAYWRRRVERAFELVSKERFGGKKFRVSRARRTAVGATALVHLPAGCAPSEVIASAEHLASILHAREARLERERRDASRLLFTVLMRDPFGQEPLPPPWAAASCMDLFGALPIGVDELGRAVEVTLPGNNFLMGGQPGSGKSNLLQLLAAATALDPSSWLYCLDPKVVELSRWRGVAKGSAGPEVAEAVSVLEEVSEEMGRRYAYLEAHGARQLTREDGFGLVVVLVDEATIYLSGPDKAVASEFSSLLRKLVSLGRAAGVVVCIATQKPATDVIASSVRDNISVRAAFRCTTKEASDVVLGSGWATKGTSASEIDPMTPGVCYLLAEGATPEKIRCYYLSDSDLDLVATRAEELRR
ncbi:MAG: FtsK/SpoIIIE domain-containing protein [Acidimicrobiales bacterium]